MFRGSSFVVVVPDSPCHNLNNRENVYCAVKSETYLQSSVTQQRLNNLTLLHCRKERTGAIDLFQVVLLLWGQMSSEQCTLVVWRSKYIPDVHLLCYTCAQCECVLNTVLGIVDLCYLALLQNKHIRLPDYHPLMPQTTNCTNMKYPVNDYHTRYTSS